MQNGEFWLQVEDEVGFISKWHMDDSEVVLADNWEESIMPGRKFRLCLSNNKDQHKVLHGTWDLVKPSLPKIMARVGWEVC